MLSYMNPSSADEDLHASQSKPPEQDRSRSLMELTNIINCTNERSRMIGAPNNTTGAMCSWDSAAGMMGSWKPGRDMCRNPASLINNLVAPPSSYDFIMKNLPSAVNTSVLNKYSSPFQWGAAAAAAAASETKTNFYRAAGSLKVKKKRVRPSRRVPTTVVKTDTTNFKAMVHYFTGIPHTTTITGESTLAPSASSYSPQSTISAASPSFSNSLHPILCEISNPPAACLNPTQSAATATCSPPLLSSSFPSNQSASGPPLIKAWTSITGSCYILNSASSEELTISANDSSFFDNCLGKY